MPRPRRWLALIMVAGLPTACRAGPAAPAGGTAGGVTLSMADPGKPQSDSFNPFLPTSSLASYGISALMTLVKPAVVLTGLRPAG